MYSTGKGGGRDIGFERPGVFFYANLFSYMYDYRSLTSTDLFEKTQLLNLEGKRMGSVGLGRQTVPKAQRTWGYCSWLHILSLSLLQKSLIQLLKLKWYMPGSNL